MLSHAYHVDRNVAGYWDQIVTAKPDGNSKRSLDPRHVGQRDLNKRFFSDDSAEWSRSNSPPALYGLG